jgi:flagellar assembly factor FliW
MNDVKIKKPINLTVRILIAELLSEYSQEIAEKTIELLELDDSKKKEIMTEYQIKKSVFIKNTILNKIYCNNRNNKDKKDKNEVFSVESI